MKLIIYDSVFGNTEKIAVAMGVAIDAKVIKVSDITPAALDGLELLIVGSPTRAFNATPAVSGWIKKLDKDSLNGIMVAAFDTRLSLKLVKSRVLNFMVKIFGYAAKPMLAGLIKKGGKAAAEPEGFYVADSEGPLLENELERAEKWALNCLKNL